VLQLENKIAQSLLESPRTSPSSTTKEDVNSIIFGSCLFAATSLLRRNSLGNDIKEL